MSTIQLIQLTKYYDFITKNYRYLLQLTSRPWSKPLTMGNQLSETQDKYRGVPVPDALITKQLLQLPTLIDGILNDHHNNGHTEVYKNEL